MYKPVTVFDVSQTEGKPLPQLAVDLTGDVQNYEVFMEAVKRSAPVPVFMENMAGMDGYYDDENRRIAVRTDMSEVQTVCAAIHEIAHSLLHGRDDVGEKYQVIELFEERIRNDNEPDNSMDGFQEIPTEEMEQLGLPEEWLKQK